MHQTFDIMFIQCHHNLTIHELEHNRLQRLPNRLTTPTRTLAATSEVIPASRKTVDEK